MPRARARDLVRRSIGAVVVTALLGAAVAVGAGFTLPGASSTAGVPVRTIAPVPTPSAVPTAVPSRGAEPAGIALTAQPESDGGFRVTEVVTLPVAATEAVLRPPTIADAGTGFERLRPAVTDLVVEAGGQPVARPDGPVRTEVVLRWDTPATVLRLRYRLTSVSVASAPARAGRTLAVLGPLAGGLPADLPVTAVVRGRTVLSLTCPQLPLARLSCGAGIAPEFWTLRPIPYDRSRVQVQYDRPTRP